MSVILVHIILAVSLFFLVNWIGKHSYSLGYVEISVFVKSQEAPAFNFIFRILTPIVYLIIVSTILYSLKLDRFVKNIYLISLYYILFRLLFNLVSGRALLMNWSKQIIYSISIIVLSYYLYVKLIQHKKNLLPDFGNISNELWIIIGIFIYQVINGIVSSGNGPLNRQKKYLTAQYNRFKRLYGRVIESSTTNENIHSLIYSIMIYENFNRPKIVRVIENLSFIITNRPHTLGVMQVTTNRFLNDRDSVKLGIERIIASHAEFVAQIQKDSEYDRESAMSYAISKYNSGGCYLHEVIMVFSDIQTLFYPHLVEE